MSVEAKLAALPTLGSINVVIRANQYAMYAVCQHPKVRVIEVSGSSFEDAATKLIQAFGA